MRVLDAISDGAGGPATITVGNTLSGDYYNFENLRDDKVLVLVKWDGVGEWTMLVQALVDHVNQMIVAQFYENESSFGATDWTTGAGPFSYGHDTVNNIFWLYLPKFPEMRVRVSSVAVADTDIQAWFIA